MGPPGPWQEWRNKAIAPYGAHPRSDSERLRPVNTTNLLDDLNVV
jgi:hypothetical protein